MFLLHGLPSRIECWFGSALRGLDRASLRAHLAGAFPDMRFHEALEPVRSGFGRMRHALVLAGVPGAKEDGQSQPATDQLEKLCRGLYGTTWLYAAHAEPMAASRSSTRSAFW